MKTTLLSFFLFVSFLSGNHFEVIHAYSEAWISGTKNGGTGTEYYFKTVINSNEQIEFDRVWIDDKVIPLMAIKGKQFNPKSVIAKNDTIMLRASYKNDSKAPVAKPPMVYKGAALIEYMFNGKKHYFAVKKIEKRQSIPHQ